MKSEINIRNTAEVCYIDIDGTIGVPEEWQFDDPSSRVTTFEKFKDTVAKIADIESPKVVVNIRSTGGDVHNGIGFFGFPGQAALDQLHSLLSKLFSALDFGFSNYQSGQLPRLLSQPST